MFNTSKEGQVFNFDNPNVINPDEYDTWLVFYNWLANSATTLHVCNQHEAFTNFHLLSTTTVTGVGNLVTKTKGQGTVELMSWYNNHKYILQLKDVLYIPNNHNNLIALGKWDQQGRHFIVTGGVLTLITKDGILVVQGTKVGNNLYKMNVAIRPLKPMTATPQIFSASKPAQSWERWHKRFGHTSYHRLQHMLDNNLVNGFNVDMQTQKPDCIACTEVKQIIQPFGKATEKKTESRELTHINLWGKYSIKSINGNNYYILFIDDSERFSTTEFLKQKSEAPQKVKEYSTYPKTQDKNPKAIHVDLGKEFVNNDLKTWCWEQGIEIQTTTPYSPSQNGIAKQMNCAIVEPAHAMLHGLPKFLWEYAISHLSYLWNQMYTKTLNNKMLYEMRFKNKPNVSHLQEFEAPIWVLLQDQKQPRKMESKSRRWIYVGYDDGSKSIKYYNAETHKILTSQNFCFLTLTNDETPPEPMIITPDVPGEGEPEGSMQPTSGNKSNSVKWQGRTTKQMAYQRHTHRLPIPSKSLSWWERRDKWSIRWEIICHNSWWWTHKFERCKEILRLARMGKGNSNWTNPAPTNGNLEISCKITKCCSNSQQMDIYQKEK